MFKEKSLIDELTDYVRKNLKKGYTKESLRWALLDQGYSRLQVNKAIKRAEMLLAAEAPVLKTKPKIEHRIIIDDKQEKQKDFRAGSKGQGFIKKLKEKFKL
ncbi:hypothetical protein D6817_03990 [Candidatus Pacearchaeota archaeon]|nr:MAG: hypothetical protein D6817_03990 [Candidatus Pacearchaeota archaeon]